MQSPSSRTRLRRTFRYPDDSSVPETLDEQEQESLISDLSAHNALQNYHFTRLLLLLPLATTIPYLPLLFRPRDAVIALLSLTSLLSTTYLLYILPPEITGLGFLDAYADDGAVTKDGARAATTARVSTMKSQARRLQRGFGCERSPLETYLPYLNGGLVVVLALMGLMGLVTGRGTGGGFAWIGRVNLPGIVYAVVLVAKVVMGGVDPERELSPLKYEYRGA
ncbi:hypothetical protein E4U59_006227 [Claviceps monticola]|nr:hypothetical protein E4U59_006227 [Claviceps monticola]